ncbi:MAG: DinB family protein [Ferruginibacter sp.]
MEDNNKQNAVNALLAEYTKAVHELQNLIVDIRPQELVKITDQYTSDPQCKSIQKVLTHVVSSGYSYCVYIQNLKGPGILRPAEIERSSAAEYIKDLDELLTYTQTHFANIQDTDLEEFDEEKKIKTAWGQSYDIEQIMEHAIVHILRHRRQIERFKILIGN